MTFRNSHWVGLLLCTTLTVSITPLMSSVQAETLKITGPNGEVRQTQQQYGPTTSRDTFWSIAQKVRPNDKVSIYQVMAAIFDANPHAFSGNNYNTLERGMILIIPAADVMSSISQQEAKTRAENNDRAIKQGITTPQTKAQPVSNKPTADKADTLASSSKPATAEKPLQIVQQAPVAEPQKTPQTVKNNQAIADLSTELDRVNNKNVMITDELARAQDQLMVTRTDNQALKQKIEELSLITGALEEELQLLREKHESLIAQHEILINEQQQENKPAVEQPTDFWRSLTDNTALLIAAAALPLILIFGLIFWLMRRRSANETNEAVKQTEASIDTPVASQAKDTDEDDLDSLAVHLDSDDAASIDDLLDLDSLDMQPEAELQMDDDQMDMASEMFVAETTQDEPEPEEDEGTSLDDLWAEAMDDQDSELDPLETDDDLDNLLAGLDDPIEDPDVETKADEDDLDALLANFGKEEASTAVPNDNVDDILADFDFDSVETDDSNPTSTELTEEVAAELDNDTDVKDDVADDDIDALLADFNADDSQSAIDNTDVYSTDKTEIDSDLADEIAAELDSDADTEVIDDIADDDIDALLAGFNANESASSADDSEVGSEVDSEVDSDLADEIAAELDSDSDSDVKDDIADDDIDALLAGFNADESASSADDSGVDSGVDSEVESDLADEIAAELDSDADTEVIDDIADDDIDALLAGFNTDESASSADDSEVDSEVESNLVDEIAAELDSDIDSDSDSDVKDDIADDDIDALLAGFNANESASSADDNEVADEVESDLADEIAAELDSDTDIDVKDNIADDDIDALLAGFNADDSEVETNLADEIAAELDSDSDSDVKDDVADEDVDSLLASFEASDSEVFDQEGELDSLLASNSDTQTTETENIFNLQDDLSFDEDTNDTKLETDPASELEAELDLDALLTELDPTNDDDLPQEVTPSSAKEDDLSGLLSELEQASETQSDEEEVDFDILASDLRQAEQDAYGQELLPQNQVEAASEPTSAAEKLPVEKESGFFNDLKASKKPQPEMLDWEADLFKAASKTEPDNLQFDETDKLAADEQDFDFSDDDLLAAFSESLDDQETEDDFTSEDDFVLSDDNLTVDEALAALDAKQTNETPKITEAELSSFERENGFIDIDKLLNDADEGDDPVTDKYKEVDVDMGEFESLLGNADMVDVDDEENSVNAKLDLARAYIEIEDEDSAKALLKEVQMDGNDRQQSEAAGLLKKLT